MFGIRRSTKTGKEACAHAKALPRWDKVEDAGDLARVSVYYCPACDQFLPPDRLQPTAEHTRGPAWPG